MSKITELTIDEKMANVALRLVEWYVNDNKDIYIRGERVENGDQHFWFEKCAELWSAKWKEESGE